MPALAGVTPKLKGDGGKVHKAPPIAKRLVGSPPISRVLSWATIPLGPPLPTASSSLPGSDAGHANAPLFGLAPNEVCHAVRVTTSAVGSYPGTACAAPTHPVATLSRCNQARHHFTLTCACPPTQGRLCRLSASKSGEAIGGIFLLHCLSPRGARSLTGILPCGARTFLQPLS